MRQNSFENKKLEKVLIEQISEFELRGPGPPGRICTFKTNDFYDKTKESKQNFRLDYCLLLKYCTRQCTLLPLPGPNNIKLNLKKARL